MTTSSKTMIAGIVVSVCGLALLNHGWIDQESLQSASGAIIAIAGGVATLITVGKKVLENIRASKGK